MLLTNLRLSKEANSLDLDEGAGYIIFCMFEPLISAWDINLPVRHCAKGFQPLWMRKSLAVLPKCARAQLGWEAR